MINRAEKVQLRDSTAPPGAFGRRRLLAAAGLGLTAVAAGSSLTACSSGAQQAPQVKGANAAGYKPGSAQLQVQLGKQIKGPHYPSPWRGPKAREIERFGDGSTTFTVLTRDDPTINFSKNAFTKKLEEMTGVKINYQTVPMGDDGTPKINAIIASGNLPDAFMVGPEWMGGFSSSQIYLYGQQGLFQPIDELVDKYAPQLLELFKVYSDVRPAVTMPDHSMYMFPAINDCYHCRSQHTRAWINKNWLEKVDLDIPKTTAELTKVLNAFKSKNPSGVDGSVPFSASTDMWAIGYFLQSFLYSPQDWIIKDGGKLVFTPTQDKFRDALAYVAELVQRGLFDRNAFTQTSDQLTRRVMNKSGSMVGMTLGGTPGAFATIDYKSKAARWRDYVNLPPVTGPDGNAFVPWGYSAPTGTGNGSLIISKTCKDPKTMVRWADAMLALTMTLSLSFGPRNDGWTWAKSGMKGIDGRQAVYDLGTAPDDTTWNQWGPYALTLDVRNANAMTGDSIEPLIYAAGKASEQYAAPRDQFFETPVYSEDQAAEIGELTTNITNYYSQATSRFALGTDDVTDDNTWKRYLSKFDSLGLARLLKINADAARA